MHNHQLIICADDYAEDEVISEGILKAANKQRINAISCLVTSKQWPDFYSPLLPLHQKNMIGLHLNLTLGQALSREWKKYYASDFYPLSTLISMAYFKRLDKAVIASEIKAQIQNFTEYLGFFPDFIDGHQHCHQLPIIREALLEVLPLKPLFIRSTSNGYRDLLTSRGFPKRQALALLGGLSFKKSLQKHNINTNSRFSGVYNFAKSYKYRYYFQKFLTDCKGEGLIMCHPGLPSTNLKDPLCHYRYLELAYLLSDDFLTDLKPYASNFTYK